MAARENAFHSREVWWHSKRFDDEVKSLCCNMLCYMMVACSRLQDMQKKGGVGEREGGSAPYPDHARHFRLACFLRAHYLRAWPHNLMVTVKLTIIYY